MSDVVRIPLRARDGSVRAWVQVDEADHELVSVHRWYLGSRGYAFTIARAGAEKHTLLMHRLILGLVKGDKLQGDHINHDKLDNRRVNLRSATCSQNHENFRNDLARGGSRYRGVWWAPWAGKWRAGYAGTHVGYFDTEEAAAAAVSAHRARYAPFSPDARELAVA